MARCKRCNSFMLVASSTGYCNKCNAALLHEMINKEASSSKTTVTNQETAKPSPTTVTNQETAKPSPTTVTNQETAKPSPSELQKQMDNGRAFLERYYHGYNTEEFMVQALACGQISPNSTWEDDNEKITLLTAAIKKQDRKLIDYLLTTDCDVNAECYKKAQNHNMVVYDFPLSMAIKLNDKALVNQLIECGADINQKAKIGSAQLSMLHLFAGMGNTEQVSILLKAGVDPNVESYTDGFTATPLVDAVTHNKLDNARLLITSGADVNYIIRSSIADYTILNRSVMYGEQEAVSFLLESGADPNSIRLNHSDNGTYPALFDAVSNNYYEIARMLIEAGADVNLCFRNSEMTMTPFMEAAYNRNVMMMDLLTKHGGTI